MSVALATNSIVNLGPQYTKLLKSPNMKKFLCALWGIALALTFVGCSSDDGEESRGGNGNGGNNGSNTDYIATTQVKELTLPNKYWDKISAGHYLLYEDYTRRFYLSYSGETVYLSVQMRSGGKYQTALINETVGGIKTFPNIQKLDDLNQAQKAEAKQGCYYRNASTYKNPGYYSSSSYYPDCGFIAWFVTETNEELFVRIRTTGYSLDKEGTLESISIEYQLF